MLIRPKNACKGCFCNFFYLHADEQGKTRSSFPCQTSFPPWPRGKGDCLSSYPHRLTMVLGGSRTEVFNSSLAQLKRPVLDPPKTQVRAGRGVKENTCQYREAKEANVICLVFLTDI